MKCSFSGSLKIVTFESFGTVSYSHSITTLAVSLAVSTIGHTNVTDIQPDRQTPHDSKNRSYAASLGCSRPAKTMKGKREGTREFSPTSKHLPWSTQATKQKKNAVSTHAHTRWSLLMAPNIKTILHENTMYKSRMLNAIPIISNDT